MQQLATSLARRNARTAVIANLRSGFRKLVAKPSSTMAATKWWDDKTVALVTGANKGIGYQIARQLGELGFLVVATSRNQSLGERAVEDLRKELPSGRFEYVQADITDPASVQRCAETVKAKYGGLTVLVNNAGIAFKGNTFGAEEAATTINCNLIGTRRMCEAMLPLLSENGRIVNVSSRAGRLGQLKSDALKSRFMHAKDADEVEALAAEFVQGIKDGSFSSQGWSSSMYGISKLALNAYTIVLARQLQSRAVPVNACCPGWCNTDMSSGTGPKPAAEGADTPVWLATMPPVQKDAPDELLTGKFVAERQVMDW